MIRATKVLPRGHWSDAVADTVVLDFDDRHRRRIAMTGTGGLDFLLDLDEAVALRGGDGLRLDDGRVVEVVASPEPLVEVRGRTAADLVRLAWHIGNRHLSAQVTANAIRLRGDHVIEDMLRGLGASVVAIEAPFDPEGGAYAGHDTVDHHKRGDGPEGRKHARKHDHDGKHKGHKHDHGHDHGHDEAHGHDHHGHGHDHHGHGVDAVRRLAAPAPRLAVAGLSGRRLRVFARAGERGGRRPRARRRDASRLARRPPGPRLGPAGRRAGRRGLAARAARNPAGR